MNCHDGDKELTTLPPTITYDFLRCASRTTDLECVKYFEISSLDVDIVQNITLIGCAMPQLEELRILHSADGRSIIHSISSLGTSLRSLRVLFISRCSLKDLSGIQFSPQLEEIFFSFNKVTKLQPLCECKELQVCDCEGNMVSEKCEVVCLGTLVHLHSLCLLGNPVSFSYTGGDDVEGEGAELLRQCNLSNDSDIKADENEKRTMPISTTASSLYPQFVWDMLPNLLTLDDHERDYCSDDGKESDINNFECLTYGDDIDMQSDKALLCAKINNNEVHKRDSSSRDSFHTKPTTDSFALFQQEQEINFIFTALRESTQDHLAARTDVDMSNAACIRDNCGGITSSGAASAVVGMSQWSQREVQEYTQAISDREYNGHTSNRNDGCIQFSSHVSDVFFSQCESSNLTVGPGVFRGAVAKCLLERERMNLTAD